MTYDNLILYPRTYNKRGDESLHSVQGVTATGEDVNVKLRIPANAKIIGPKPSIAEFARDDYGAKNVCIATPDNGPDNPGGILLFTGCEPDGENRKGMPSYIARWAHRLAADAEAPAPIQGIGRIHVIESTSKNRGLQLDIEALTDSKPQGWEERVRSIQAQLCNAVDFQYQLRMYRSLETAEFPLSEKEAWERHFRSIIDERKVPGGLSGVFIRIRLDTGKFLPEVESEMVPLWISKARFQTGSEVLEWLHRQNPELPGLGPDARIVLLPIDCHTAGGVFRKHYGVAERYHRLRQQYYPGGRPEVCQLIASQSFHDGEPLLLRVHPLTGPLASPMKLDSIGGISALMVGEELPVAPLADVAVEAGLNGFAPLLFPAWFNPIRVVLDEADIEGLSEKDGLPFSGPDELPEGALHASDDMTIIDDIYAAHESSVTYHPESQVVVLSDESRDFRSAPSSPSLADLPSELPDIPLDRTASSIEPELELEPEPCVPDRDWADFQDEPSDDEAAAGKATLAIDEESRQSEPAQSTVESEPTFEPIDFESDAREEKNLEQVGQPISEAGRSDSADEDSIAPESIPTDVSPLIEQGAGIPDAPSPALTVKAPEQSKPKGLARFMAQKGLR